MKEIPLTQGQVALVDDEDYGWIAQRKWSVITCRRHFYAITYSWDVETKRQVRTLMHVALLSPPAGMLVDHKDHNTLNNQRNNIRICDFSNNGHNSKLRADSTSGFKGVSWNKIKNKWLVRLYGKGKLVYSGWFDGAVEAAKAYDSAAIVHFGDFALTNQQLGLINNQ